MKQTMKMEVRGTRAKGRSNMRWMHNIRHDMNKCDFEKADAQDRIIWKRMRYRTLTWIRENKGKKKKKHLR